MFSRVNKKPCDKHFCFRMYARCRLLKEILLLIFFRLCLFSCLLRRVSRRGNAKTKYTIMFIPTDQVHSWFSFESKPIVQVSLCTTSDYEGIHSGAIWREQSIQLTCCQIEEDHNNIYQVPDTKFIYIYIFIWILEVGSRKNKSNTTVYLYI